ncbi:MAG: hypothetical protein JWP46_2429 [Modestobacter sp.]|jgi:hypothetical protein|nr:hypothetical protein [Modestobacter sp.]
MSTLQGPAQRLTVIVGESGTVGHRPLGTGIVPPGPVGGLVLMEDVQVVHRGGQARE